MTVTIKVLDESNGIGKDGSLYTAYWCKITIGDIVFRRVFYVTRK